MIDKRRIAYLEHVISALVTKYAAGNAVITEDDYVAAAEPPDMTVAYAGGVPRELHITTPPKDTGAPVDEDTPGNNPHPAQDTGTSILLTALGNVFTVLNRQTLTYAERISAARTLIRTATHDHDKQITPDTVLIPVREHSAPMSLHFSDADPITECHVKNCRWHGHGDAINDAVRAWTQHLSFEHRTDWE